MTTNEVQKPDDATLVVRRLLKATPELAFEAWTSAEHIVQWMRPEPGMVVPHAIMDLRPGGKYRIQMKTPDGEYYTAVGEFQEVIPPTKVVYTWDWEKDGSGTDFGEVEGKSTLVTVEFIKSGDRTEMVLTHTRLASMESRDNHARGWGRIIDSFAASVEKS